MKMERLDGTNLPSVAVIVLNYKNWQDTLECLESFQKVDYPNYTLIVVDNSPDDESILKIKEWAEGKIVVESELVEYNDRLKPVSYIEYTREVAESGGLDDLEKTLENIPCNRKLIIVRTGENLGYSGGNNVGLRYAKKRGFEYALLVNPDCYVVEATKARFVELFNFIETRGNVALVNPLIFDYYLNKESADYYYVPVEPSNFLDEFISYILPFLSKKIFYKKAALDVNFIEISKFYGSCLFINIPLVARLGFFDENVFLYTEEAILSEKIKKADYKMFLYTGLKFLHAHKKGQSSDWNFKVWKNSRMYFLKNYKSYNKIMLLLMNIAIMLYVFQTKVLGFIRKVFVK